MNRARPLVHLLLGLLLLVQGYAVAAAPRGIAHPATPSAVHATAVSHCHAMAHAGDAKQHPKPACCDDSCPDMTTCALGHLATAPVSSVVIAAPSSASGVSLVPPPAWHAPASPLRPPISA